MASLGIADALIGRTIAGKYVIESFLGGGAMGSVYRARQLALDKVVAIKVMRGELTTDRSFVGRFRREAKAASKLSHAHSINVTDFGEEPDGLLYIVMEFVAGRDLEQIMKEDGLPLSDVRSADILSQVLSAVAVAHDLGIVHRDLKPANFLIVASVDDEGNAIEHVKVCDFGIASMRGAEPEVAAPPVLVGVPGVPRPGLRRASGNNKLTAVGALLGTPEYMSPEQASGSPLGPASDIYSVGAILYELITGQTVYSATSPEEMVLKQITNTPLDPRELRPSVNEGLAAVCIRALQKTPEDRYPSARAMRADLRAVLGGLYGYRTQNMRSMAAPSTQPGQTSSQVHLSTLPTPSHAISGLVIPPASRPTPDTIASPETLGNESARLGGALTDPAPRMTLHESGSSPRSARKGRKRALIIGVVAAALAAAAGVALTAHHPRAAPVVLAPVVVPSPVAAAPRASAADVAVVPIASAVAAAGVATPKRVAAARPSAAAPTPAITMAPTADPTPAPPIAAAPTTLPAAPETASAAPKPSPPPPAAPVTPPFSPDGARVMASVAGTNRTSRASVASVVGHTSFDSCYRDVLRSIGHAEGGAGSAHLEVDEDGIITNVQVHLPAPLSSATACVAGKLRGQHVSNPDTGAATADIAFSFVPN